MPHQHTQTALTVNPRDDATATAVITIGMSVMHLNPVQIGTTAERERKYVADCEEDALAIISLLARHLPDATWNKLRRVLAEKQEVA